MNVSGKSEASLVELQSRATSVKGIRWVLPLGALLVSAIILVCGMACIDDLEKGSFRKDSEDKPEHREAATRHLRGSFPCMPQACRHDRKLHELARYCGYAISCKPPQETRLPPIRDSYTGGECSCGCLGSCGGRCLPVFLLACLCSLRCRRPSGSLS